MAEAAFALTAALTAVSMDKQKKAEKEQKKAKEQEREASRAQALQERKQQIRQSRIARAKALNQAAISGGEGTILSGAQSSASSQAGANIGSIAEVQSYNEAAFSHQMKASKYAGQSAMFGQAASLTSGFTGKSSLFGGGNTTNAPISSRTDAPLLTRSQYQASRSNPF